MRSKLAILCLLGFLKVTAQDASLIGRPSPNLIFNTLLNAETEQAELADYAGKVVVLDYWATWCKPCLESFPHLAALQDTFSDQLAVITITSEPRERIEQFLKTRPLTFPVAIDDGSLAEAFPHRLVPHTIVIDPHGSVVAITTSDAITQDMIADVLAGDSLNIQEKRDIIAFDPAQPLSTVGGVDYQITFSPYQPGYPSYANPSGTGEYANRRVFAVNLGIQSLYEIAYRFPVSVRTEVEVSDEESIQWSMQTAVCFDLIVPDKLGARRFEIMQDQLNTYFDYYVSVETRQRPVKVLRRLDLEASISLTVSDSSSQTRLEYSGAGLTMANAKIDQIANFLESRFQLPVIDETGLTDHYDLELPWYNEAPERIHDELKKIGLQIVDEERNVAILVIRDKN